MQKKLIIAEKIYNMNKKNDFKKYLQNQFTFQNQKKIMKMVILYFKYVVQQKKYIKYN